MERSTVDSLLRSTQAYCSQLCDKQTLDYGIAYYSCRFKSLPQANQYREIVVENPANLPDAYAESQRWFTDQGLTCYGWAPAHGRANEAMRDFLADCGFRPRVELAMRLVEWVELAPAKNVRVLPARAMRAAVEATFLDTSSPADENDRAILAQACSERLNDPQFDLFVALTDDQPAGRCALYQVGDIGRVMDLTILPAFNDDRIECALTAHVLALAKRLAMRNICVQIDADDAKNRSWFESVGFRLDGDIVEFERDASLPQDVPL